VLYKFEYAIEGSIPECRLLFDTAGNIYGTTAFGGNYGYGTLFQLTPKPGGGFSERVLYSFGNGSKSSEPFAGLVFDPLGNLYGTTWGDGLVGSTVFEIKP
jgi:uncharacterized repeat protein (TIGR03803 family)